MPFSEVKFLQIDLRDIGYGVELHVRRPSLAWWETVEVAIIHFNAEKSIFTPRKIILAKEMLNF